MEIIIYDQKNINIHTLASQNKGKSVLVVGHSNTIPFLVNDLINEDVYEEIDERIYNDLFIVEIKNNKITHNKIKLN
jgi:broad specificity phosphatase PhoE